MRELSPKELHMMHASRSFCSGCTLHWSIPCYFVIPFLSAHLPLSSRRDTIRSQKRWHICSACLQKRCLGQWMTCGSTYRTCYTATALLPHHKPDNLRTRCLFHQYQQFYVQLCT